MAVFFKRLMSCHCQINKTNQLLTYMDNFRNSIPDWAFGMNCAVTVCDADGVILYMNEKALETFASRGDMRGRNLFPCHNERSKSIMRRMLDTGESNTYTITKHGRRKIIYQTPWRADGRIAGLVEISIGLPDDMPHYDRDKK